MQIAQFEKAVFNLSAICKMKKCLFRSAHWSTVINLRNLCKLHNLQKMFSIWVQSAKRRNDFSDLLLGVPYPYQFVYFVQITQFAIAVFNLSAIWKTKKYLCRSTRWRIVPLSICVIFTNCTICKSCFQFTCNLQNQEMSFQIYSLEDRTLINLCNLCKLRNFQKLFSIWVQSAKWRNVFSDLLVRGSYPYKFV